MVCTVLLLLYPRMRASSMTDHCNYYCICNVLIKYNRNQRLSTKLVRVKNQSTVQFKHMQYMYRYIVIVGIHL